jgi:organic hydroperoxide reductase OsmC/OhrA
MADAFTCHLVWSGAAAGPTVDANRYSRDLTVSFQPGAGAGAGAGAAPAAIPVSAAPAYKGDGSRLNPELLLVSALSSCQALTYLFLAARAGVAVTAYSDDAEGHLGIVDGKMRVSRVTLRPSITLATDADQAKAEGLVEKAHEQCFISSSVTTRVTIEPRFERAV